MQSQILVNFGQGGRTMILADKIIEERKKNGWTQEDLAQKLGVSRQSVSKWESAGAIPDLKKIIQLADLFEVSTDYLLKDEIEKKIQIYHVIQIVYYIVSQWKKQMHTWMKRKKQHLCLRMRQLCVY